MEPRERIEQACQAQGLTIQGWHDDPDQGPTAELGRWEVNNEDEAAGLFEGTAGKLEACVVGAAQYHNERVHFGFVEDGTDGAVEVSDPLTYLDPA